MKNRKNDLFSKFHLLNSQENSEEIIWSSDSSDNETHKQNSINKCNQIVNRKRKRDNRKQFNVLNLDISFTESKDIANCSKRISQPNCEKTAVSPIISSGKVKKTAITSPILVLKRNSRQLKFKKNLFDSRLESNFERSLLEGCNSYRNNYDEKPSCSKQITLGNDVSNCSRVNLLYTKTNKSKNSTKLIDKVKAFIDSNLSSESTQYSISECETESVASSEVEITNSLTPVLPIKLETKSSSDNLSSNHEVFKSKKAKYKNGSLSDRLNMLLEEQKASFSKWQNEKFLAENTNFVIPREDFFLYRIKNVTTNCGLTLLNAVGDDNTDYLILINNLYVTNDLLKINVLFKLYRPFKIIDFDVYKLVINVYKFDVQALGVEQ